jgi:uncharacterized protein
MPRPLTDAMRVPPTIIVFAREAEAGSTKTRLIPPLGARNAAMLADAFTRDAIAKAYSLGLPLVIAASASGGVKGNHYFRAFARKTGAFLVDQGEGSLGARMARVLEPYAVAGAVLIGTDTPSLPTKALSRGIRLLQRAEVVLGPSLDGAYYLVGLRGHVHDIFRRIRWGSGRVLGQTIDRLERNRIRYVLGPAWYDIDRWDDLLLLARHLRHLGADGMTRCPATARVLRRLGLLGRGD